MRLVSLFLFSAVTFAQVQMQDSHTKESLRGVSVVDAHVIWASGTHGTYVITTDGGKTWTPHQVPDADDLDFRGVKAFGAEAFLLAAGPGDKSRIYHTSDFGKHWELQFTNPAPKAFFDCMAFSDPQHGIAVGDPVNGKFEILRTQNGGKSWRLADSSNMPAAHDGEGAFAASNSCIAVMGKHVWFVTGGPAARVFRSKDGGTSWTVVTTPIVHGAHSQGIFSVAFRDARHGVIAGGDYAHPEDGGNNLAITDDGGKTWRLADVTPQKFFSAVAYTRNANRSVILVGSGATACSADGLRTWAYTLSNGFNAIESKQGVTFVVGANGKLGRVLDVALDRR